MFIGEWQWLDFANIPGVLDWIGFVVGGIGLGFALFQLASSRSALTAAKEALEGARVSLIRDHLLGLLPAFNEMAASLMDAINADSREVAGRILQRFMESASEAEALLATHVEQHPAAIEVLTEARVAAAKAIDRLYQAPDQTTSQRVGAAASALRSAATTLAAVRVSIRNEIGSGNAQ